MRPAGVALALRGRSQRITLGVAEVDVDARTKTGWNCNPNPVGAPLSSLWLWGPI